MSEPETTYPDKQPFPRILAVSLEGKADANGLVVSEQLPTLELSCFSESRQLLADYLSDYQTDDKAKGLAVGVRGAHGAGKTHLIRYLMRSVAGQGPAAPPATPPVVVYVKVSTVSDFFTLYRQFVAEMGQDALVEVNTRWLSQLVQQEASKATITQGAVATLQQTPNAAFEYLNAGLVSSRAVVDATRKEIRGMPHYQDFVRVASYVLRPELRAEAYTWFLGVPQGEATLRRLGVSRSLDADLAREALHFLVTIFGLARQPLLVFIDQIERLLRHPIPEVKAANIGVLYSLAEWFAEERGFLCLAGATDAWERLEADFFGRLHRQFVLPGLSPDNCLDLVKVYVHPLEKFSPYERAGDVYPFTEAAIKQLATISGGNPRRFLRVAFRSFELAQPTLGLIDSDRVVQAYGSVEEDFDRTSVMGEIQTLLREAGLTYVEQPTLPGDAQPDLAVLGEGRYLAFVDVSDAIFARDEAEKAFRYARVAPALKRAYPDAKYILVVAGYASQQIQDGFRPLVDRYMSYAPETFSNEFKSLVNEIAPAKAAVAPTPSPVDPEQSSKIDLLVERYAELQQEIARVLADREHEGQARASQLREFSDYSQTEVGQKAARVAASERDDLERIEKDRVAAARLQKRQRESAARKTECDRDARAHRSRLITRIAVTMGAIGLVGVIGFFVTLLLGPSGLGGWAYTVSTVVFIVAAILLAGAPWLMLTLAERAEPEIVRTSRAFVDDLAVIDEAALRMSRERTADPWPLLSDANPQVRYLGARSLAYRPELFDFFGTDDVVWPEIERRLLRALSGAVSLDVQRALLVALTEHAERAQRAEYVVPMLTSAMADATDAEVLYFLDALERLGVSLDDKVAARLVKCPPFIATYGILTSHLWPDDVTDWRQVHIGGTDSAAVDFAARLQCGTLSDTAGRRLADAFAQQRDAGSAVDKFLIDSFGLATVRPQLLQRLMELYGLGDEASLGYYPDLRKSSLLVEVYDFLFQLRLTLAEYQHKLRSGVVPAATP